PSLRGIASTSEAMSSPVGMYVDGVPILSGNGYEADMLDIESVEVLHGPQGTLYGKGAEIGAIKILTRKPGNEFQGRVMLEGGKYLSGEGDKQLQKKMTLFMDGPIAENTLFFGVSGMLEYEDGFIRNRYDDSVVDDARNYTLKGQIRWTPSDNLETALIVSHLKKAADGNRGNFTPYGVNQMNAFLVPFFGITLPAPQYRIIDADMDDMQHEWSTDTAALKISYTISDNWRLQSVTSWWDNDREDDSDYDFNNLHLMHSVSDFANSRLSEELQFNFESSSLKGVVGIYADMDETSIDSTTTSAVSPMFADKRFAKVEGKTIALFSNITWQLAEQWSINAGLRCGREEREFTDKSTGITAEDGWNDISPRLAFQYQMTPDDMLYASISKGFRSGGFTVTSDIPYDPETVWSFEIGSKNMFLDNKLMLGTSIYYMNISDMQVRQQIRPNFTLYTNAAEASGFGAEIEALLTLTKGFTINGSFGYSKVTYDEFSDTNGDYKDNRAVYAPEYTCNLGVQYRHASGFYVRGDLIGQGRMYFDQANKFDHDPYALVNARIGYEMDSLDIYVYGKNILDTEYDYEGDYGGMYTFYGEPCLIGLQLVYHF
ncbi:MAG: TonB-dependent receptor, partial [Deltaproteobacteria bacterium]